MKRIQHALQSVWRRNKQRELRQRRDDSFAPVEEMERRLCLGALAEPIAGDWSDMPQFPPPPAVSSSIDGLSSNQSDARPPDILPPVEIPDEPGQDGTRRNSAEVDRASHRTRGRGGSPIQAGLDLSTQLGSNLLRPQLATHSAIVDGATTVRPGPNGADASRPVQNGGESSALANSQQSAAPTPAGDAKSDASATTNADSASRPQSRGQHNFSPDTLASYGFTVAANGDAVAIRPWWEDYSEPVVVKYDFRDVGEHANEITEEQKALAVEALSSWTAATDGMLVFEQDTAAAASEIINIGTGSLEAFGHVSGEAGTLGLGGGTLVVEGGVPTVRGVAWLDNAENWDTIRYNGNPADTFDYFTAIAHETGHALGLADSYLVTNENIMYGIYDAERSDESIAYAARHGRFSATYLDGPDGGDFTVSPMTVAAAQLTEAEVEQLLARAAAASESNDAIIAIVDRAGNILGVRVESDALAALPDENTLVFAIDGAIAKARTAAFFSNGDPNNGTLAPLTSRLVEFVSQSTVTQREVESNPNAEIDPVTDMRTAAEVYASTEYGPGFVAPIGLGAHFPPGVEHTPPVDLFGIEHTNRDSLIHPGPDGIKATADDIVLPYRFNANPAFVDPGQEITPPESYGTASGRIPSAQSRGIATLPGGVPIFRDTNEDGVGETLIGGIGVFFPGETGYATFEQNFQPDSDQTRFDRVNAPRVLEAEYIAYAALGGSQLAADQGIEGAVIGELGGIARVPHIDIPFGRLDLVGINLPVFGPIAGREGLEFLIEFGSDIDEGNPLSGANQPILLGGNGMVDPDPMNPIDDVFFQDGEVVPDGWLVNAHDSSTNNLTEEDVEQIINQAIQAALEVRAAVRLPRGSRTRMVFAVTDTDGEVLGLFRMQDATVFSIDVAVAKARNVAYYADETALQPFDQVVEAGAAFTNRTFRFIAEPRFPDGVDGTPPGPFSILNQPSIDPDTGENEGAPAPAGNFDPDVNPATATVLGFDAFFPNTNFQDPDNVANQNGVVFFPGSIPIYKNGELVGGLGVSGDGVDQDDVVTFFGAKGFEPPGSLRADQFKVRGVRLPFIKFLRNPFG